MELFCYVRSAFSKLSSIGYLHWLALATVICDSISIAYNQLLLQYPIWDPSNPQNPPLNTGRTLSMNKREEVYGKKKKHLKKYKV